MVYCCVRDCQNNSKPTDGDSKSPKIGFYKIPSAHASMTDKWRQLVSDRRALWLSRLGCSHLGDNAKVCSDHFISGMMYEWIAFDCNCDSIVWLIVFFQSSSHAIVSRWAQCNGGTNYSIGSFGSKYRPSTSADWVILGV